MSDQEQTKRRGRPPKYAGEGKRQNFSFPIRDKVREQLVETVKETGRSLSEEIEWRIERSFEWEQAFGEARKWLGETKAKYEQDEAGTAEVVLRRNGWPKVSGTKWGTVLCRPGSIAMIDGRAFRVLKADFPNGTFNVEPATDLMGEASEEAPSPALPPAPADLEETMYRAVLRALRDARSQDLAPPEAPASPAEQTAWEPIAGPTPNPDEPAQDGQSAKGSKPRTK